VGTISALMGKKDLIFSDALNHASIVDGCRLCGAKAIIYPHRDLDALEQLIKTAPRANNRMIITDGIFSVDGTIAPLPGLVELAKHYGCWLMVDEAHATGVLETGDGAPPSILELKRESIFTWVLLVKHSAVSGATWPAAKI